MAPAHPHATSVAVYTALFVTQSKARAAGAKLLRDCFDAVVQIMQENWDSFKNDPQVETDRGKGGRLSLFPLWNPVG